VHLLAEIVEKVIIFDGKYRHTEKNSIKADKFISNNLNRSFLNKFCRRTQISSFANSIPSYAYSMLNGPCTSCKQLRNTQEQQGQV
jgi:hypothetical protein